MGDFSRTCKEQGTGTDERGQLSSQAIAMGTTIREMEATISVLKADGKAVEEDMSRLVKKDPEIWLITRTCGNMNLLVP